LAFLLFQFFQGRKSAVETKQGGVPMTIQDWLTLRTYHHTQFADIRYLLELKERQDVTISLCLPTLNEASTIGPIITTLSRHLQKKFPLIDEILVIDSGSEDNTVTIARNAGARVFFSGNILPENGMVRGKGENLWKSLFVAKGDIIVWVDTDIRNMHPRFVYGLVGPILTNRDIGYVKGFYRRPLQVGKKLQPVGGGRVTEILVKPFFNALFPNLAVFQQPLSGEYAGRREILERVPFFTGYGVETGLLIDLEARFGLQRMAQVDLEVRIHRNQDLQALKKMAMGILRVLFLRAEQHGKLLLLDTFKNHLLEIFKHEHFGYQMNFTEINEIERPPMITVPAYQKKYGLDEEHLALLQEVPSPLPFKSISPYLDTRLIILNGTATTKKSVLWELSNLLYHRGVVSNPGELLHQFYRRESLATTGMEKGIAIPHAIYPQVKQLKIAIYRPQQGVDFGALDAAPTHLIFAVVAPISRRPQYLNVLSVLARILRNRRFRTLLMAAKTPIELLQILKKADAMLRLNREFQESGS